jgi:glycosyltransferase involved in cell wall biosynthesis
VTLLRSRTGREAEFLAGQFKAIPLGIKIRPDVIVCQSPALGGLAAVLIARLTGARTLMELHGMEYFVPARVGSRLWWLQQISRIGLRAADRIRLVAPSMAAALSGKYGAALSDRARIVPPRVDIRRFSLGKAKAGRRPGDLLRIVMVGAVNSNKGQLRLIRAIKNVPFATQLDIVGDGPDLVAVRRSADSLALCKSNLRVQAHGRLPHSAVAGILRECDLFVFYSRMESAGRAMMEAMAAGLPVITTNAGFCVDFVEHGREGFILGPDCGREILDLLGRLRTEPELAERMGAAASARARRDYDSVRLFGDYRRLIEETAAS